MARGWESKDVESQVELAGQRAGEKQRRKLTLEQMVRKSQRESLLLDRTRLLHDLDCARHPRHTKMIQDALDFIEHKLADIPDDAA